MKYGSDLGDCRQKSGGCKIGDGEWIFWVRDLESWHVNLYFVLRVEWSFYLIKITFFMQLKSHLEKVIIGD